MLVTLIYVGIVLETIINGVKGTWSEVGNLEQEIFHDMIQSVEPLFSISCILCEILNCGGCFVAIIS